MNQSHDNDADFNRRDFLKGSSFAALMTMMGGVQLMAQSAPETKSPEKEAGPKVKVAVIGLGSWGREILDQLGRLEKAQVVAICDPDRSRGESRAKEFKIEDIYDTAGSLFSGAEFDALDVVSPREPRCLPEHPRAVPKTTNAHTGRGRIPPPQIGRAHV